MKLRKCHGYAGLPLRILESGEFIRVGSNKTVRTDVRIIAPPMLI
nr:sigma 54-interacting transcriptional regulator [Haliscomenobacter sp.]